MFHDALLKTRKYFQSKNNHQSGFVQILAYLEEKNVEGATIPVVSKMRRNLSNCYNHHKKNNNLMWPLYKMCEIIFDNGTIDDSATVKFGDALLPMDPVAASKLFTKGTERKWIVLVLNSLLSFLRAA